MEEWNDLAYSEQETLRKATNSEMDPGYFRNTPLSTAETMQKVEHMVSHANNAGSADCCTLQETNTDNTLHGECAIEDQGPDHENSMSEEQDNIAISCNTPHSSLYEVFEDNSKEADIKRAKNKIVDATCPNDNSSKTCQQECNVSTANRAGNRSSVVPYTLMKSEDSATPRLVEDDLALNGDGTTELSGVEQKAKEASRPNASILGHNEVSNMSPTPEDTDGNASTLNPDDDTDTDACTNTAGNKQQDGGKVCEGRTIDWESKRSAGHGEDLTELLHPAPSIKEADVTEKRDTVCNDITHNDNSSTGLHLEDTSLKTIISPDNNSSKILKTKDSSTAGNEKTKCSSESQRSNMTTKLSGSEHIEDDFCYSHGGYKSLSTANDTGRNASSISNDDSTNIKDCNISACSKLQGEGDLHNMEAENKKSMENKRSNNDVPRSKKHRKKACRSKQINKVTFRPNDDKQAYNRVTVATKTDGNASIDDGCNQNANISKTNTGASSDAYTGRRRRKQCFKSDATTINHDPEDRTSSRDGGENSVLSFLNLKRQDQSQTNEANPIVSDTTSSTCFQKHGDVSTSKARAPEKSWNVIRGLRSPFTIYLLLILIRVNLVQGEFPREEVVNNPPKQIANHKEIISEILQKYSSVPGELKPWLECLFHKENVDFSNQSLGIQNPADGELKCRIENIPKFPFFRNCSGYLVCAPNETHIEVILNYTGKIDLYLEHGKGLSGEVVKATCGELMTNKEAMEKISKYKKLIDSPVDTNQTMSQSKDENKTLSEDQIIGIAVGVPLGIVLIIILLLLFVFRERIKSRITSRFPCCGQCAHEYSPPQVHYNNRENS